ncbi:MAG TPA: SCO family protein [Cellvibrio sp.]|nr:SCO family protein [Cellvibrio sp.]
MTTFIARAGWIVVAMVFLLLGGFSAKKFFAAFVQAPMVLETVQLLPEPKPLPQVLLRTATGDAFARERFQHHWNLVFFGFTSCPDFCPLELQKLGKLLMMAQQEEKSLQVIFVSVDPERDTAERLAQYVSFFHPAIIGLRGDNPAIASLARFFGATYERSAIINERVINIPAGVAMPGIAGEQYQVNHSTRVFVIDPQGQYIGSVAKADTPEILWADLQKLF